MLSVELIRSKNFWAWTRSNKFSTPSTSNY